MSDSEPDTITKPKALKPRSDAQKAATEKMLAARKEKIDTKKSLAPEGKTLTKLEQKKLYLQAVKEKLNKGNKAPPPPDSESEPDDDDASDFEFAEPEPPKPKKKTIPVSKPAPVSKAKSVKNKTPAVHIPSESEESEPEEVIVVKKAPKKKKPKTKTIIIEPSSDEGETDSEDDAPAYVPPTRATKTQRHKASTHRAPPAPSVTKPTYDCYFA